ncbi:MAG TPA: RNHCP domain-containing protein [Deinococcales bacterium]|nr:RNHCP domain-containing protein [Deinococcales bacterium]
MTPRRFLVAGRNEGFTCAHCGAPVPPLVNGSVRNHCPRCLHSLHVDENPGDRASDCGGLLRPVSVEQDGKKDWVIVHRCERCGAVRRNKAALNDPVPDDWDALVALSRPAQPEPPRPK